jgi:hypothetical protein
MSPNKRMKLTRPSILEPCSLSPVLGGRFVERGLTNSPGAASGSRIAVDRERIKVTDRLPNVQDLRKTAPPVVVEGRLRIGALILGLTFILAGLPVLLGFRWWTSIVVMVSGGLLAHALFRCSACGRRRPWLAPLGGQCPYCRGAKRGGHD